MPEKPAYKISEREKEDLDRYNIEKKEWLEFNKRERNIQAVATILSGLGGIVDARCSIENAIAIVKEIRNRIEAQ